ncbi:MAG: TolC family protein [bacterium]
MPKLITFILLLFFSISVYAQQKVWTLEECVEHAKKHNIDIQRKRLEMETSRVNLSEAKWAFAPAVSVSNDYSISQGRVLDPTTYEYVENSVVAGNSTSVYASLSVFNGMSRIHTVKLQKTALSASLLGVEKAENDLMLNITAYYLEILLAKESIRNAEQTVSSLKTQKDKTAKMVDVGKVTNADLLQIEAQLSDAETNLIMQKNQLYIAKLNICQLLEIEDYLAFEIAIIDDKIDETLPLNIYDIQQSAQLLPEIKMAELGVNIEESNLNIARSALYPTISIAGAYSTSYSSVRQKLVFNTDSTQIYVPYTFLDQYQDNLNSYIAVSFQMTLFNGLSVRKNIQRRKIALQDSEYNLRSIQKQVSKEVNQAYIDMTTALEKYNSTLSYLLSAQKAYELIESKYNVGATSILDYNTALNNYVDASSKHIQAKYEYIFKTKIIEFYMNN